jgi:hypothetical protein
MILFADDTTQLCLSHELIEQYFEMQGDINKLLTWCKQWCVTVNATKTEYILYCRKEYPYEVQLTFDGNILNCIQRHKHLGVILDASGSWNAHVESII